jgi:hypothetical protein
VLADHSMLAGFVEGSESVQAMHVRKAAAEVIPSRVSGDKYGRIAWAVLALLLSGFCFWLYQRAVREAMPVPVTMPVTMPVAMSGPATTPTPMSGPISGQSFEPTSADGTPSAAPFPPPSEALPNPLALLLRANRITPSAALQTQLLQCPAQFAAGVRCLHGKAQARYLRALRVPYLRQDLSDQGGLRWTMLPAAADYSGEFIALYRLDDTVQLSFGEGYAGPGVATLAQALAVIDAGPSVQRIYGPQMRQRVRRVQRLYGIAADGIVGPATWLALSRPEPD